MIYVTSDLHGYPTAKFRALLQSAGFTDDDFLFVLGDVIDRNGDGGIDMLRWMMRQPNVELLKGNHEAMLLACDFIFDEITNDALDRLSAYDIGNLQCWLSNGAAPTIKSMRALYREDPDACFNLSEYLRDAPLYDTVSLPSGEFILTHAGLGNFSPYKELSDYAPDDLLWYRPKIDEVWSDDAIAVFGHTPVWYYNIENGRMLRTRTWIDIDTGAAGGGSPMLLRLDDLREFYCDPR